MEAEILKQEENGGSLSQAGGVQPDTATKESGVIAETKSTEDNSSSSIVDLSKETEERESTAPEQENKDGVIDERHGGEASDNLETETVCRICHVSSDNQSEKMELIQLGCGCKGELGASHLHCAETWFKQRGNRSCEICGEIAKNITGIQDTRILIGLDEMRFSSRNSSTNHSRRERSCHCRLSCNFIWAFLLFAFMLSWFFRVDMP